MRLFFAVMLPELERPAVSAEVQRWRAKIGDEGVHWNTPDQWHYTLKFLPRASEQSYPCLVETGTKIAAQFAPFRLTVEGVRAFAAQNMHSAMVLWLDAREGVPVLFRLAECFDETLAEQGFAREERPYRPHLTIARTRTRPAEKALQQAFSEHFAGTTTEQNKVDRFADFVVQSVALVESELRPGGSVYTVRETFPLKPQE